MSETMEAIKAMLDQLVAEDHDNLTDNALGKDLILLEIISGIIEAERSRRLHRCNGLRCYAATEHTSASAFLIDRCRIAPGRASRLVAQSNSMAAMPGATLALMDGTISSDQVRHLMVAHDTNADRYQEHEQGLLEAIGSLGVIQSGRAITYWRQAVNEPAFEKEAETLHGMRQVHLSTSFEGMGRLDGWLDPVSFEIVKTALDAATPPPAQSDSRTPAQRRADTLVDLARTALDDGRLPESGGEKPHLTVRVSLDQLTGHGHGQAETVDGTILARSDLQFMARDCSLTRLVMDLILNHSISGGRRG